MMNPKSPKRDAEIHHDKDNIKSQRLEQQQQRDQPKSSHKSIVTYDCNWKDDTKKSSGKEISIGETNVPKGKIPFSDDFDDFDDGFSDTDDDSDNESSNSFVFNGLEMAEKDASGYENIENLKKYIVGGRMDYKQAMLDGMKALASLNRESGEVLENSEIAQYALDHFRTKMKGGDYEYVKTWSSIPIAGAFYGVHMNFFAQLKGSDSTPELFFASLENGDPMEVLECCILNPRPFSLGETPPDKDVVVYHSESVRCTYCNVSGHIDMNQHRLLCL